MHEIILTLDDFNKLVSGRELVFRGDTFLRGVIFLRLADIEYDAMIDCIINLSLDPQITSVGTHREKRSDDAV